jgi:membrane carboxypeptidase/penicillin-binding protein PbpC
MGNPPRITSPTGGHDIFFASPNAIPLRAKTDADVREIYWFADKTFIGKSNVTEMLTWKSTPGDYQLTALDDHGRSASCSVTVR